MGCVFDHLNLQWRYEAEAYTDGVKKYLPDFHLPEIGWFLEVKGSGADYDIDKVTLAVRATGDSLIVWRDEPAISWAYTCTTCPVSLEAPIAYIPYTPDPDPDPDDPFADLPDSKFFEDHPFWWCQCPRCKKLGLAFDGESDRLPCNCNEDDPNAGHTEALHRAVTAARNYRFRG